LVQDSKNEMTEAMRNIEASMGAEKPNTFKDIHNYEIGNQTYSDDSFQFVHVIDDSTN
jgi:hypothetical protein